MIVYNEAKSDPLIEFNMQEDQFDYALMRFEEEQVPYFFVESPVLKKKILVAVYPKSGLSIEQVKQWLEWRSS